MDPASRANGARPGRKVGRGWPWNALRLLVSLALLALALRQVDWASFWRTLQQCQPLWLAPALLLGYLDRAWMAGKWVYLLRGLGVPARFRQGLHHYLAGGLVGLALQWQLGGDIARAVGLGRDLGRTRRVIASVTLERIAGASASGLLTAVSLVFLLRAGVAGDWSRLLVAAGGLAVGTVALGLAILSGNARGWARRLPGHWLGGRLRPLLARIERLESPGRVIWVFYLLTLAEQLVPFASLYLRQLAFGLSISVVEILLVMPVIMFLSRLPIAVESIGVREGLYVLLFGMIGIGAAESVALALTSRAIDAIVVGTGHLAIVRIGAQEEPALAGP